MSWALVIHRVDDLPAWRRIFDEAAPLRHAAGEREYRVLCGSVDEREVVHLARWTSVEAARAFFESPRWSRSGSGPASTRRSSSTSRRSRRERSTADRRQLGWGSAWLPNRDLFAGFERMRREMDELFGDVFDRALAPRRAGFTPRVDVYYTQSPAAAVIAIDLAGITVDELSVDVQGRIVRISGRRPPVVAAGRVYQQLEIEHGPFERVIELASMSSRRRRARPTSTGCSRSSCPSPGATCAPTACP